MDTLRQFTVCGLSELGDYRSGGVTHVISILDPGTPAPDMLSTYPPHSRMVLRFHDEIDPAPHVVLPDYKDIEKILAVGREALHDGAHVLIHCHMGVSRSAATLAALLAMSFPDEAEDLIFARVLRLRPNAWPNSRMIALADELLGRSGRLTHALGRLYATQLARQPEFGRYLRENGRGREVDLAERHAAL